MNPRAEEEQVNPHLVIVTYAFPPSRAVGAIRPFHLARSLSFSQWKVTVVTPSPTLLADPDDGGGSKRFGQEDIEMRFTGHRLRLLMGGWLRGPLCRSRVATALASKTCHAVDLEREIGWRSPLEATLSNIATADAIIATGPPFFCFRSALRFAERTRAVSVLDYRDLWTESPHPEGEFSERSRQSEKSLLEEADGVWAVSPSMSETLEKRFPGEVNVVSNGFDPAEFEDIPPRTFDGTAIVYAGSFYPPKRIIDPLLLALQAANRERGPREITLHYFGTMGRVVCERASHLGVSRYVVNGGHVPRRQVLGALKGCSAALVVTSVFPEGDASDASVVTAKLFEAIGAGAPVLLVAPKASDARRVVSEAAAGEAFTGDQIPEIAAWLTRLEERRGPIGDAATRWSWGNIGCKADALLRGLLERKRAGRA